MTGNVSEFVLLNPDTPPYPWQRSNEVAGFENASQHYASEPPEDCTQVRGLIFSLTDNGGFLAGWSCGGMDLSGVSDYVHSSLVEVEKTAEHIAKEQAEKLRSVTLGD